MLNTAKFKIRERFTWAEMFFCERTFELINKYSTDSFRVRLHNPKSIVSELRNLYQKWYDKQIRDFEYIETCKKETVKLLQKESELDFGRFSKEFILKQIGDAKGNSFRETAFLLTELLKRNEDYLSKIVSELKKEIEECNRIQFEGRIPGFHRLDRMIGYLITEILNLGYAKNYLNNIAWVIFILRKPLDFSTAFSDFHNKFSSETEKYAVFFRLKLPGELKDIAGVKVLGSRSSEEIESELELAGKPALDFLNMDVNQFDSIVQINVDALDHFSAIRLAKERLDFDFDLMHFGFKGWHIDLFKRAYVRGEKRPEGARSHPTNFVIDGYMRGSQELTEKVIELINAVTASDKIDLDVKQKIHSAIRFLRIGNAETEIQQKFLNYWIGLEGLYSTRDFSVKVFRRIIQCYKNSEGLIYFRRIFENLRFLIRFNGVENLFPGYDEDDPTFLLNVDSLQAFALAVKEMSPLLATRSFYLSTLLSDSRKLRNKLDQHREHLEWNFWRIYRVRNEIAHNALIVPNLETTTAHLRFYLQFSISRTLDFFTRTPIDVNLDTTINMEDFHIYESLQYQNALLVDRKSEGPQALAKRLFAFPVPPISIR